MKELQSELNGPAANQEPDRRSPCIRRLIWNIKLAYKKERSQPVDDGHSRPIRNVKSTRIKTRRLRIPSYHRVQWSPDVQIAQSGVSIRKFAG